MMFIGDIPSSELKGTRVLVRAGLDLPLTESGEVSDLFRVKRASETLRFLSERGAKVVILSHIGRDPEESNEPVARALKQHLPVVFVPDLVGPVARHAVEAMREGEILLLENLRRDAREVGNDADFSKELARFGDLYVNDAFSAAHRAHASVVGIPRILPAYAGFIVRDEVQQLSSARHPSSPSFAILGGAKFETKAPLIKSLLATYDHLFLTGALANDVFKAEGLPVGISLVSKELPGPDVVGHPRFVSPVDVTVELPDKQARVKLPKDVAFDEKIVDIGPDSIAHVAPMLNEAKFILWNGPTGLYEGGYIHWTHALAELVRKASARGAKVIIGGGDTVSALSSSGIPEEELGFLSTGGGAMLEYLLKGTLPALDALERESGH